MLFVNPVIVGKHVASLALSSVTSWHVQCDAYRHPGREIVTPQTSLLDCHPQHHQIAPHVYCWLELAEGVIRMNLHIFSPVVEGLVASGLFMRLTPTLKTRKQKLRAHSM